MYEVLSKIMRAGVKFGLIQSSPCDGQDGLPTIERQEMLFLDADELATLAGAMDERYRALVLVGGYGGLRAGELFGLRRGRVDLLGGRVEVAEILVEVRGHHHFGPPKTKAGRRSVPLPRFVVDVLTEHCAGLEDDDLVFPAPDGGPARASLFRRRFWRSAPITSRGSITRSTASRRRPRSLPARSSPPRS